MAEEWFIVNVEAVVVRGERFLLTLRSKKESHVPGMLSLPGGKVERAGVTDDILEETLRREIREEVGVEVAAGMAYVESKFFVASGDRPVVDVVFLCQWARGEPRALDPAEVAAVAWLTLDECRADPRVPVWTRASLEKATSMTRRA